MRALCGAIIAAGALVGLGLTAIGFGMRYSGVLLERDNEGNVVLLHLSQMDRPLVFMLVFLVCCAVIGLAIAFVGLAFHHHRRYHEFLRDHGGTLRDTGSRMPV